MTLVGSIWKTAQNPVKQTLFITIAAKRGTIYGPSG